MARRAKPKPGLPPPLPPERRTVGQLVAESIRLYGAHFFRALSLGLPVATVNVLVWASARPAHISRSIPSEVQLLLGPIGGLLITISFVAACAIVTDHPFISRSALTAYVTGVLVFIPFPFLAAIYVLPGLAWLALFGLAVPAALVEGLGIREALARGFRLARVDFVHVLGGLATLALVVFLTQFSLFFVLREYAENTRVAAAILASLVASPLLFLGGALLYVDQEARLRSRGEGQQGVRC